MLAQHPVGGVQLRSFVQDEMERFLDALEARLSVEWKGEFVSMFGLDIAGSGIEDGSTSTCKGGCSGDPGTLCA
jgi:hypothetical protein